MTPERVKDSQKLEKSMNHLNEFNSSNGLSNLQKMYRINRTKICQENHKEISQTLGKSLEVSQSLT